MNEDLADPHVNEIPAHKEDQPQSSSLEPSATVSTGIETTPISNDFELSISIQTSVVSSSKRSRIESVIKRIVTNIDYNHKLSIKQAYRRYKKQQRWGSLLNEILVWSSPL